MGKHRRKNFVIGKAVEWYKDGDSWLEHCSESEKKEIKEINEKKIVHTFCSPKCIEFAKCERCNIPMDRHGWMKDGWKGRLIVCPGDWIITRAGGGRYLCKLV
jgi:hypothetical protein